MNAKYTPDEGEFFSIADLARAVKKRLWLVILIPLLAAAVAVAVSLLQPPVYEASAMVVVSPRETSPQENVSNTISGLQMLAHEMAVLGLNRSMVEDVVDSQGEPGALSTEDLNDNLTAQQVEDTRFLSLTYTDTDPEKAQAVANSTAKIFARKAPEASGMVSVAAVSVSAYAPQPIALEGPNPLRNGLLGLALGLMLGVGMVLLLERSEAQAGRSKKGPAQ